jgi:hypothetical protein
MHRNTVKALKIIVCALALTILLTALLPVCVTADVSSVTVSAPASMTPLSPQTVSLSVDMGPDVLSSLNSVTLKLWYDSNGGPTNPAEFDAQTVASPAACAIITWSSPSSFAIIPMSPTTWSLNTGNCITPTLSNHSGVFTFVFTPGAVAGEASGSALWQIGAVATSGANSRYGFAPGATMNLYQQLSISGSPALAWGAVSRGMGFTDSSPCRTALGQTVTIISNAAYKLNTRSDAQWIGASHYASLDPTGVTAAAQMFALKAANGTAQAGATLVGVTPTQMLAGSATGESGSAYSSINVWLKLAGIFVADTYSGVVNFSVSN